MTSEVARDDATEATLDEAVAVANRLEPALGDGGVMAGLVAIGWVLGGRAACCGYDVDCLNEMLAIVVREARRKYFGVRRGTWPSARTRLDG